MPVTTINHPVARIDTAQMPDISRAGDNPAGFRDRAFVSGAAGLALERSRDRATVAVGDEWARLRVALVFFRARLAADFSDGRPGRFRV